MRAREYERTARASADNATRVACVALPLANLINLASEYRESATLL